MNGSTLNVAVFRISGLEYVRLYLPFWSADVCLERRGRGRGRLIESPARTEKESLETSTTQHMGRTNEHTLRDSARKEGGLGSGWGTCSQVDWCAHPCLAFKSLRTVPQSMTPVVVLAALLLSCVRVLRIVHFFSEIDFPNTITPHAWRYVRLLIFVCVFHNAVRLVLR